MEQTVNQFSKGLQLDTHPMVQGNDSLSDALNATFITMNGNEVILQNDMGNRRVDNAFLPPGYQPVGMKEYGGIIYVAAYNPITNKSQIGSFPSPEKKIDINDDENLGGSFDFDTFLNLTKGNISNDEYLGIKVLNTDSFLIPLTGDTSLRAGDKFAVWSTEGLAEMKNYITNYKNVDNIAKKAKSPKNRKYTLYLGVLNSQNEFVDITKTLCRWEKKSGMWKPKKYDYSYSDIYKFNDEYFIPDGFTNIDLSETIRDSKLIKERQQMAANTYAYKLIGPLYLKTSLNHIENFNYTIYGTYDSGEANLQIEGYLTYNCPDNPTNIDKQNGNENYINFDEGIPQFDAFDLILNGNGTKGDIIRSKSTYNPNTNLYSVKIVKKYSGISANPVDSNGNQTNSESNLAFGQTITTYNYTIGVLADKDTNDIYIRGLSARGSIDLALLGSGKVFLTGWRFRNDINKKETILTYTFNAYPEYGKRFDNLKFKFTDVLNSRNTFIYPKEGGLKLENRNTDTLSWDEYGIQPRTLYKVTATYDIIDEELNTKNNVTLEEPEGVERWFLSTPLFNEFYQVDGNVPDFCDFNKADLSKEEFTNAKKKFEDLMIVNLETDGGFNKKINEKSEIIGSLIKKDDPNIEYRCKHTINLNLQNNSVISIKNEENYPSQIHVSDSAKNSFAINGIKTLQIGDVDLTTNNITVDEAFKQAISLQNNQKNNKYYDNSNNCDLIDEFKGITLLECNSTTDNNNINISLEYNDLFLTHTDKKIYNLSNVFCDFYDDIKYPSTFAGPIVDWDSNYSGDKHIIKLAHGPSYETTIRGDSTTEGETLENEQHADKIRYSYLSQILKSPTTFHDSNYFYTRLSEFVKNDMFTFIFIKKVNPSSVDFDDNDNYLNYYTNYYEDIEPISINHRYEDLPVYNGYEYKPCYKYTRVWMKSTNDGVWGIFQDLLERDNTSDNDDNLKNNFQQFIKNHIDNYIYCKYDNYTLQNSNIYISYNINDSNANYTYTLNYDKIKYIFGIDCELLNNNDNIISISSNYRIGNLNFKQGNFAMNNSNTVEIDLTSSTDFHNNLQIHDSDVALDYVYLKNGNVQLMKDIVNGSNKINEKNILLENENGKLDIVGGSDNFQFTRGKINENSKEYSLLYNSNNDIEKVVDSDSRELTEGTVNNRNFKCFCQRTNTLGDSETVLVYDKVYLIKRRDNSTQ